MQIPYHTNGKYCKFTRIIDGYWSNIFLLESSSNMRYNVTARVVKAALSSTHGYNVERGVSGSGRILTDDRANIIENTLDARFTVKEG